MYPEYSGAESSPALTDTSEMPAETPEFEREEDVEKVTLTPSAGRTLFSKTLLRNHASGRGEIARSSRDKIRKRKRLHGDRDVGSGRSRLPHDSDDSDSDWEDGLDHGAKRSKDGKKPNRGWVNNFLSAVSDHPSAPAILSKWLQLGVNVILLSLVLFGMFAIFSQVRSDLSQAGEKARAAIVNEMSVCTENYRKNGCAPRASRAPALDGPCNEWEACMNQDPSAIMHVQISAKNIAEIMNEFVGVLTFKTWVREQILFGYLLASANRFVGLHSLAFLSRSRRQQCRLWISPRIYSHAPHSEAGRTPAFTTCHTPHAGFGSRTQSSAGLHMGSP